MRPIERIKIYLDLIKNKPIINTNTEENFSLTLTNDIYSQLEKIWLENPDWRFTQLCVNTGLIPNLPGSWYYVEDMDFMLRLGFEPRDVILWGTYGKDGKQPLSYILLKNMENGHIESIINTQNTRLKNYFIDELNYRKNEQDSNR